MPLPYGVPEIQDNPDGWGPCSEPEQLKDVPFAPFSKSDKLGKAADWTQQAYQKYPGVLLCGSWEVAHSAAAAASVVITGHHRCCGGWQHSVLMRRVFTAVVTLNPLLLHMAIHTHACHTGRYQANPANAVFQFFHNEEVCCAAVRQSGSSSSRQQAQQAASSRDSSNSKRALWTRHWQQLARRGCTHQQLSRAAQQEPPPPPPACRITPRTRVIVTLTITHQEDSFHLVDNRPAKATKFGQRRFQQNRWVGWGATNEGQCDAV
jgi:hypothetical protein